MIKPACPRCITSLERRSSGGVLQYACPTCAGFGSYFGALRKIANPSDAKQIWMKSEKAPASELPCSFCRKPMRQILVGPRANIELDLCRTCHAVWFDLGEWETIRGPVSLETMREDANSHPVRIKREYQEALVDLKRMEEESRNVGNWEAQPDATWKYALALCGLPVEEKAHRFEAEPWLTWLLIILCLFASAWGFRHMPYVIDHFAFHANASGAKWLMQVFAHFFFHGSVLHLLGNMYFLWVFGDNVEDELGKEAYLALILLATVAGCLLFAKMDPNSGSIPAIGASGGIFGVVTYYLLKFPHRKFLIHYHRVPWRFLAIPGWLFGLLYFALPQILGAVTQAKGGSKISYLSHIGGGIVGALFALISAKSETKS